MRLSRLLSLTIITGVCIVTAACSTGFGNVLAYGYQTQTAIQDATAENFSEGRISAEEATEVADIASCINRMIDSAATVWESGQTAQAQAQMAVALTLLAELQTYDGDWTDERCSP